MTDVLHVLEGHNRGERYEINDDEVFIGRDPKCRIVIRDRRVSRTHARVVRRGPTCYVEDCDSRNQTYVNGVEVEELVPLAAGDEIRICATTFRFRSLTALAHESATDDGSSVLYTFDAASKDDDALQAGAARKLQAIMRVTESLGETLDRHEVLSRVLRGLLEVFPRAERGLVLLRQADTLVPAAVERRDHGDERALFSRTIVEKAMRERQAILSEDLLRDPAISATESVRDTELRSVMCVPLLSRDGNAQGVIQLDSCKAAFRFQVDDVRVLTCVAGQVSIFLENAKLHQELVKHERERKELDFARAVQFSFLPRHVPEVPGYRFWAFYEPARRVGGDFYDFLQLPGGRIAVLLGDAAGKGTPASLVMARISGFCKLALLRQPDDLAAVLRTVNAEIQESGIEPCFMTLVICRLDPQTHEVAFASAGHMSPIVGRSGKGIEEVMTNAAQGYPLGTASDFTCGTVTAKLHPGEFVAVFSDGVADQMNSDEEQYSSNQIRNLLRNTGLTEPKRIGEELLDDVRRHMGSCDQTDDMSLVVFRRCTT
jgi:sigma-B regulation protein RsbU (phosphoserine phosphatase)